MLPETHVQKLQNIKLKILGNEYTVSPNDVKPETSLNEYLRKDLGLTGTKHMCLEGGCGACVVVATKKNAETGKQELFAINSCLVPVLSCNDWEIETIDGIGGPPGEYHMVQKVLADFNGTQCGYCSPGMVMNMYALYESGEVTMQEVENSFGGNICRCTGYRPIIAAFKSLCKDADEVLLGTLPDIEDMKVCKQKICRNDCGISCSKKQVPFSICWEDSRWVKVYKLIDLLEELKGLASTLYMLIAGSTGKGVYRILEKPAVYIDVKDIPDLLNHQMGNSELILGANVSLTYTMNLFYKIASENPKFSHLKKQADHIDLIANVPVRNVGTLAGNLMLKHQYHEFPSDIFLILETVGATLTIIDINASETSVSLPDFLNIDMKQKVLKNIIIPALDNTYKYESYKIMPRAQNAHALVNAGFLFKFNNNVIEKASIVYGCINPQFIHAKNTEDYLTGKDLFDNKTIQGACEKLAAEIQPDVVPAEPQPEFRKQLAIALFYKTVLSWAPDAKVNTKNKSGGEKLNRPLSSGTQDYETNKSLYPLTQAVPKIEALAQTSGRAEYIDDIPDTANQLYAKFVLADAPPTSEIKKIDASKALEHHDIVSFYTKDDIPGQNNFMTKDIFPLEEEIFCSGTVKYHSQPVGLIVGKTREAVDEACSLVSIEYSPPRTKPLLTIPDILRATTKDKIKHDGSFPAKRKGADIKHVIKGTFDIGMQYHYHMELQVCKVVPTEDGLDVYPASQWMNLTQNAIANMLNIKANQININVRRCGGAFGAKISRNNLLSCAASLAAWKLRKPVKISLSMEENCQIIGKRYPMYCDYEVGVNDGGVIQYLKTDMYSDMGQGGNENPFTEILDLFTRNYDSDTFEIETYTAYTDLHANTWCRAPGSTEGLGAIESIMEHIAYETDMDALQLKIANISKEKELLNYIADMREWASIDQRRKDIENFNKENRWKKKGLAVVPMAYGFHIFGPYMATVTIYEHDGSVAIIHGGIEIGQGINTKVAQVCAYKLGIPLEKVVVKPSNNFSAANACVTGGSITSEAVCYGVIKACDELLERLKPHTKPTWEETVSEAYKKYENLSATGQYSPNLPDVENYTIYGVCACEVLLDVLTGQYLITRVDMIEDTGTSMNPMVDIGQVEGAFVMGMGYYTSEKVVFDENGKLLTNRTWNYKPPGAKDIPVDFRVKFPKNNGNPVGVLKAKATGEPPLCMSVCVPLAIRNAVASARTDADSSKPKWYPFEGPSTVEQTFMQCLNNYTQYVL